MFFAGAVLEKETATRGGACPQEEPECQTQNYLRIVQRSALFTNGGEFRYAPTIVCCRGIGPKSSLKVEVLPKTAPLAFSCQHAFASVYEFPGKSGKAIL